MKKNYLLFIAGVILILFFSQCEEEEEPQPKAVIQVSESAVTPLDTVYLDGSVSENAESYEWSISDANVTFVPTGSDNSAGYIIPKVTGTLDVSLTVTNSFTFNTSNVSINVSGAVEMGGTLSENTTLSDLTTTSSPGSGDPDYMITEDLIIPEGVRLDIESLVDITVADDIAIIVDGELRFGTSAIIRAAGTAWKGIYARDGRLYLSGITLSNGGSASFTEDESEKAMVYLSKNPHSLKNVTIEGSAGYAVVMDETASLTNEGTQRIVFKNNATGPGIFSLQVLSTNYFAGSSFKDATSGTMIHVHGGTMNSNSVNFLVEELPFKILSDISAKSLNSTNATLVFANNVGVELTDGLSMTGSTFKGVNEAPGSWKGIYVESSGYANVYSSSIMHAGSDYWTTSYDGDIKGGIVLDGAPLVTSNSVFNNNGGYGVAAAYYSQLSISDGITLNNNSEGAIYCNFDEADDVAAVGTFTGYSSAQPIITMKNARTTDLGTWPKIASSAAGIDYYIKDYVSIGTGKTLTVEDQVQVYFAQDAALNVQGTLDAQASSQENSINFRGEESTAGFWRGIEVASGATIKFDYVQVNFGGSEITGYSQGNLNVSTSVNTTDSFVTNSSFLNGGTYDLYFFNASDVLGVTDVSNNNVWSTSNL